MPKDKHALLRGNDLTGHLQSDVVQGHSHNVKDLSIWTSEQQVNVHTLLHEGADGLERPDPPSEPIPSILYQGEAHVRLSDLITRGRAFAQYIEEYNAIEPEPERRHQAACYAYGVRLFIDMLESAVLKERDE